MNRRAAEPSHQVERGCPVLSCFWKGPVHHRFTHHRAFDFSPLISERARSPQALLRSRTSSVHHLQLLPPRPTASSPSHSILTLTILEEVRKKYEFVVLGYVIMPEHVHLLISEPRKGDPSLAMQVFKQRTSRGIPHARPQFWQLRFYDFQRLHRTQTSGKASLHALESSREEVGVRSGGVGK